LFDAFVKERESHLHPRPNNLASAQIIQEHYFQAPRSKHRQRRVMSEDFPLQRHDGKPMRRQLHLSGDTPRGSRGQA
jgi:hypothetical protein